MQVGPTTTLTFIFRNYRFNHQLFDYTDQGNLIGYDQMYAADPAATTKSFVFGKNNAYSLLNNKIMPFKSVLNYTDAEMKRHVELVGQQNVDDPESIFRSSLAYAMQQMLSEDDYEEFYSSVSITAFFEETIWRFMSGGISEGSITIDSSLVVRLNTGNWKQMPTTGSDFAAWNVEQFVTELIRQ